MEVVEGLWIEPEIERKIGQPPRIILQTELYEAAESADDRGDWWWDEHEKHGWRYVGLGETDRQKPILMVVCPRTEEYDREEWQDWYDEWDGPWNLMTALRV